MKRARPFHPETAGRLARKRHDGPVAPRPEGDDDDRPVREILALPGRFLRSVVTHPREVGIALAAVLAAILIIGNWRSASVFLILGDVTLPFVAWALIFAVLGYVGGKWIERSWRRRTRSSHREAAPDPSVDPAL